MSYIIGRGRYSRETYPGAGSTPGPPGPPGPQGPAGPAGPSGSDGTVASYFDETTGLTSTTSLVEVPFLRQNGGAVLEINLLPWTTGNVLLLWCSASYAGDFNTGGSDNVIFVPQLVTTSGTTPLQAFGDSYSQNFYGSSSASYRIGPLGAEASMFIRVNWRTRFGSLAPFIDPTGVSNNDFPSAFQLMGVQVRV